MYKAPINIFIGALLVISTTIEIIYLYGLLPFLTKLVLIYYFSVRKIHIDDILCFILKKLKNSLFLAPYYLTKIIHLNLFIIQKNNK
ncbi:hypothetical protein JAG27_003257 [Proteus mirabilis]|uniref:Membrane protein n=8 Tax=Morganellaceae TaxID=1903414 RepID=B4EVK7_PROMH|nr:hypothetical protein AM438_17095 [Proteus mirabilis]NBN38729.1 hypothetical protein [Proteus sp. G2638]NBN53055.1 hypothetical protein [Proteus sp. G4380]NBN56745.1 hypothetical protein [Proteus sp. G3927]CAR42163.1 putative membrane protein [Proteus mirabilis HI4320]